MSAKKWVALASLIVAVSLPSFANSSASELDSHLLLAPSSDIAVTPGPVNFKDGLLFHNTLQDVTTSNNGALTANWMSSQPAELKNEERTATLPEPGSGVLLCIGLLALLYRVRAQVDTPDTNRI